jgi:plastocyanin domain-containing protein
MTATDLVVIVAALASIALVNWYFFVAGRSAPAAAVASGGTVGAIPEVTITVDGGYSPNVVQAKVGEPLRLVFDRKDDSSCSEEIVMPEFGVRRFLPTGTRTAIDITPTKAGRHQFTCGMGMLRGTVIVDD